MSRLIAFVIVCLCFYAFFRFRWIWLLNQKRRKGLLPLSHNPTMFDVRQLIMEGERELAVRLYCEIFSVNRFEAEKAVKELEKSIQEKDSEIE